MGIDTGGIVVFREPEDALRWYGQGFRGCQYSPSADRELGRVIASKGQSYSGETACRSYNLTGSGQGVLALPYLAALELYPDCLPGGAQGRGSCVAWSTRNAAWVSYCAYLKYGTNESRSRPPALSPEAVHNGCASTEAIYWHRKKDSDGWFCHSAVQVAIQEAGLVLRKEYPELGLDLTKYSAQTEGKWGRTPPPASVRDMCDDHLVKNATKCDDFETICDMLANGYALTTCGSEGFSDRRNDWGICSRQGTWHHAMAVIASDSRPATIDRWGQGLLLFQNSWGDYLTGTDFIKNSNHRIPVGSFWALWSDVANREYIALGPSVGWPANKIPDSGLKDVL